MKAILEKIAKEESTSFVVRQFEVPTFDAPFHFHPEYELTLILQGEGQRYIGKQVHDFFEGDLVFLGSNLPHCWINRQIGDELVSAIVIQFDTVFLGNSFMDLAEMKDIKRFLQQSKSGIEVLGKTKERLTSQIKQLVEKPPLQRLVGLIEILHELSQTADFSVIDFSFLEHQYSQTETTRFQQVFSYLIENFKENITLEEIADIAHLSPTSFCRYFKSITQKTFVEVLLEYRLQYACQLLTKTQLPIQQIAFESGFGDVPYFNKQFKKYKKTTPTSWRLINL